MAQFPQRKSIRLPEFDYSQENYYFITICTYQRNNMFGQIIAGKMYLNDTGKMVENEWHNIPKRFNNVAIDKFVIMPNHVHGIIHIRTFENGKPTVGAIHELPVAPLPDKPNDPALIARAIHESPLRHRIARRQMMLPKIIGYFKMNSSKKINMIRNTPGQPVWQRNYYERIIADDNAYAAIWDYIDHNPDKWENDRNHKL